MNLSNINKEMLIEPIGIIRSPYKDTIGVPKQPYEAKGIKGKIEIFPEFIEGLKGLEKFKHIILLFNFHLSNSFHLQLVPYNEKLKRGVFATRSPHRPNQLGMSIVKLNSIRNNIITISNVDIIDGTPLLDIKPFISEMDCFDIEKKQNSEWLKKIYKRIIWIE